MAGSEEKDHWRKKIGSGHRGGFAVVTAQGEGSLWVSLHSCGAASRDDGQ